MSLFMLEISVCVVCGGLECCQRWEGFPGARLTVMSECSLCPEFNHTASPVYVQNNLYLYLIFNIPKIPHSTLYITITPMLNVFCFLIYCKHYHFHLKYRGNVSMDTERSWYVLYGYKPMDVNPYSTSKYRSNNIYCIS